MKFPESVGNVGYLVVVEGNASELVELAEVPRDLGDFVVVEVELL